MADPPPTPPSDEAFKLTKLVSPWKKRKGIYHIFLLWCATALLCCSASRCLSAFTRSTNCSQALAVRMDRRRVWNLDASRLSTASYSSHTQKTNKHLEPCIYTPTAIPFHQAFIHRCWTLSTAGSSMYAPLWSAGEDSTQYASQGMVARGLLFLTLM